MTSPKLEYRICNNNHKSAYRFLYKTGDPDNPVEGYLVCKKCSEKPHYDNKYMISKDLIKDTKKPKTGIIDKK